MSVEAAPNPRPELLNYLESGSFPPSFPGGDGLRKGRSARDGYARGWGLEFGGLAEAVQADPVYQECYALAEGRTIQTPACRMNLYLLVRYFLPRLGAGAIVEFGSYRGGSAIFLAALCRRLGLSVKVYGLDTFAGMPRTDTAIDAHRAGDFRDTSLDELRSHVAQCGLDPWLEFVPGRFELTAPAVLTRCGPVLLAHIDCDIESAVAYSYNAIKASMADGGYIVFDDAHSPSCLGATEVVEELAIRRDGLNCEQISPHFVFRSWRDYAPAHDGQRGEQPEGGQAWMLGEGLKAGLLTVFETLAWIRLDYDALLKGFAQLQRQVEQNQELQRQYLAAEERLSKLEDEHGRLLEQVRMACESRWLRLGRLLGVGPRFR